MSCNIGMKTNMVRYSVGSAGHRNKNRTAGFALMELILAVAIISVLTIVAFNRGQRLFDFCYKFIDKISLATLVADYNTVEKDVDLSGVTDMKGFAVALAKAGGPNNVASYQSLKRHGRSTMDILVNGEANKELKDADFDFIAVKPNNKPTGRDVLFCTRGLQKDGKWTGEDALYGTKGGLVAFRDGSVRFLSEHTGAAAYLYGTTESEKNF